MTPLYVLPGVTATALLLHVMTGGSPARHWPNALRLGLAAMFILTGVSRVRSRSHRTLMLRYRERLSEARFQVLRPGGPPWPSAWPEVRAQLTRVAATEGAGVPAQARPGETP